MNAALLANASLVLALVAALAWAPRVLGPEPRIEGDKGLPYESGMPPMGAPAGRMWVSYFRFAVLFVVFDVDLALLLPWALMRDRLDLEAMVSMSVFVALIAFTLAYAWRKGALECE